MSVRILPAARTRRIAAGTAWLAGRVQGITDRRFNRSRSDAHGTLAPPSARVWVRTDNLVADR
ncbi:MAG TPA: hypothetical protein VIM30_05700 [Candidatus Limnocylindrales bacterium]|jgi:hypothetical protein